MMSLELKFSHADKRRKSCPISSLRFRGLRFRRHFSELRIARDPGQFRVLSRNGSDILSCEAKRDSFLQVANGVFFAAHLGVAASQRELWPRGLRPGFGGKSDINPCQERIAGIYEGLTTFDEVSEDGAAGALNDAALIGIFFMHGALSQLDNFLRSLLNNGVAVGGLGIDR